MDFPPPTADSRDFMLHLVKLIGSEFRSVEQFEEGLEKILAPHRGPGKCAPPIREVTRNFPSRSEELLDGGSLYWIVAGAIRARQKLLAIRRFRDRDGIGRCALILAPGLIRTRALPRIAFQGWRYMKPENAPEDLEPESDSDIHRALDSLGLR